MTTTATTQPPEILPLSDIGLYVSEPPSPRTTRRHVAAGKLKIHRISGKVYVRRRDLAAYLAGQKKRYKTTN